MHTRTSRALAPLLLALVAVSPAVAGEPAEAPSPAAGRDYEVIYRTVLPRPAEGAAVLELWVPLPLALPGVQEVRALQVEASTYFDVRSDPVTGNRMVHARLTDPDGDLRIVWKATVRRHFESGQEPAAAAEAYLAGDGLAPVDETARAMAQRLGVTDAGLPLRTRARRIYDHVVAETVYDKVEPGWGTGDFARVCRTGKGNCSDFTSRFVTLARAAGIPARWVSTISLSDDHAACDACGYHCYGHFLDGGRWIPVDPSDARRIQEQDPAKADWYFGHAERANIVLSVGRDLVLAPPQQGPPVNFLAGPYAEVDGLPVAIDAKNRTYEYAAR